VQRQHAANADYRVQLGLGELALAAWQRQSKAKQPASKSDNSNHEK
jgi:hypothetical protein